MPPYPCKEFLSFFALTILLKFNNASQNCHPMDQCSCKLDDGKIISLWDIDSRSSVKPRFQFKDILVNPNSYSYNPCTAITIPNSGCKDALMCKTFNKVSSGKSGSIVIAYPKYPSVTYDSDTYRFAYTVSGGISTTVVLQCDEKAVKPSVLQMVEFPQNNFITTLTSKCACPGGCKYSPTNGSGSSNSKKKLSTGSILCIILLVLVVVYIIGGLIFNKYHLKKEGSDIIPNKSFWSDLPLLAKDGVVFTYGKIRGTKTEYQPI